MKIYRFETLRVLTASLVIILFTFAPSFEILYGTTSALSFGGFSIISPLEWALITLSTKTVIVSLLVPALIVVLIIFLFGRFFCGWICPMGILLDYSHKLTVEKNKRFGALRKNREKYIVLLIVLAASLIFNFTIPYLYSPPGIVYRILIYYTLRGVIGADLAILLFLLILDVFATRYGRTWCNTLCPLGTIISIFSIVNLVRPKVDQKTCINCLECERICPMRIPIIQADGWAMTACNKCFKCREICPVKAIKIGIY